MSQPQSPNKGKARTPLPDATQAAHAAQDDSVANAETGMRPEDVAFLIDCLQCTAGGQVSIDCQAVATKRNLINHRSVANRISTLKKKYGLPLNAQTSKNGAALVAGDEGPSTPASKASKAPSRVTKRVSRDRKLTARTMGAPAKKIDLHVPKVIKKEEDEEEEESSDDNMEDADEDGESTSKVSSDSDEVDEPVTRKEGFEHETDDESDAAV